MPETFGELHGHDAYDLLGVPPDASADTIQKTWRSLAKRHHPDQITDAAAKAEAEQHLRLLNIARDVLLTRRAAYDASRAVPSETEEVLDDPWDEEILNDPWDEEAPEDPWDEGNEEDLDDPWDSAVPGSTTTRPPPAAEPADPWDTATPGRTAPHFIPPPRRPIPHPPPYPPPAYVRRPYPVPPRPYPVPPPPPYRPRSTLSFGARAGIGCAISFAALGGVFVVAALVIGLINKDKPPDPMVAVPPGYTGTWTGTIKYLGSGGSSWGVRLTLRKGLHNGDVSYLNGGCRGKAVPLSAGTGEPLIIRTAFPEDRSGCDVGDIHLTRRKDGRLEARYYASDKDQVRAQGTLDRE
ncbi:J domain-containing protein [Actinomadura roseirufa]|uniref:J domain-containing protein n=1 Tax=Actinomadura roseirufa TaxID=2094049 RepID=UPI001040E65A|nr:J domain-containing protein [Actinomadura roseirufa]